ncbi:hypothetical protein [Paraburkholderia nodosa]|uniref:hypothetical protein n=1 Tax=Paraburkholderia nodosa TaxID=392320 RepID=UPI000483B028|nr:hypothetical protein [Paraburkholderia nodosa]
MVIEEAVAVALRKARKASTMAQPHLSHSLKAVSEHLFAEGGTGVMHNQEIQFLARRTALALRDEFGEELPSAVDEILDPSSEREEIYDLAVVLAAAALVVASAQLYFQILDRERKAAKEKLEREVIRIEMVQRIQIEHAEEIKLVPDIDVIVEKTIPAVVRLKKSLDDRPPDPESDS